MNKKDTLDGWMIVKEPKRKRGVVWPYVFSIGITVACFICLSSCRDVPILLWIYGAVVLTAATIKLTQGLKRRL